MQPFTLHSHDGVHLAAHRFVPRGPIRGSVVIAPAMAVPQSFYQAFATWLAGQGYLAWTFDYRGTGASLAGKSMRGAAGDLTLWCTKDLDAVICQAADDEPGLPVFVVGHSFGGQCAPLLPSRDRLAGLVNIAVGSGSLRHNTPRIRRLAPLMWYLMAPILCPLFGYFPGARLNVVGDIPTGAMMQWRRWCLTQEYLLTGEPGARDAYAGARYAVLGLFFTDDELLLEAGSAMLHGAYLARRPDYRVIAPSDHDLARIGHFGFFKPAAGEALWPLVRDWMAAASRPAVAASPPAAPSPAQASSLPG